MISRCSPVLVTACLALAAFLALPQGCAGGNGPGASSDAGRDGGEDAGAFVLEPHAPFEATSGELFTALTELPTTGGQRPFTWTLESRHASLDWLQIGSTTGILGGTAGIPTQNAGFVVAVTDARARTARQQLTFTVTGCLEGVTTFCDPQPYGEVCRIGKSVCDGGLFGPCGPAATDSWNVAFCGADCTACDLTSANQCDGVCMCEGQPQCDGGLTCCATISDGGERCRDVQSDPEHCGTCSNDCLREVPQNAQPACADGGCAYPCVAPYSRCDAGTADCPFDLAGDVANCGACGRPCAAPSGSGSGLAICETGGCDVYCDPGSNKCGAAPNLACQSATDRSHCGGCNIPCPANPAHVDGGTSCDGTSCLATCARGWDNCDGTWSNGCERPVSTDEANCGSCNYACAVEEFCQNGLCCSQCLDPLGNPSSLSCCGTRTCDICENPVNGTQYECCTGL